jgi:hypothetical protein
LRDQTRLCKALAEERTRWAQLLHALLTHEGWPCQRARLLAVEGRRWVNPLSLSPAARGRRGPHCEPRDRDVAHPVAERGDAEPGQQPPCSAVSEQHAIRVRDHADVMC